MDNLLREFDFFWTPQDRRMYAKKIFSWCKRKDHSDNLRKNNANLVEMPWNNFNAYGNSLLGAMNNFNDKDGQKGLDYDTMDVVHFLSFISGIYTHCNTLDVEKVWFFHISYM